jgi:hypothetical protein
MFEIFGIEMTIGWYIVLFTVCQLINVALNTAKTIIMHKEEKISSSVINAITYGFYAIIVVMTASALPLWITIVISALTNLFGVYGSMWLLDRFKKDSLWEIVATVQNTEMDNYKQFLNLIFTREQISFNYMETNMKGEYVYHIYSENQKQSEIIKGVLNATNARYIVHEEKVRL